MHRPRGLFLALLALRGEMGQPSALSAAVWGFQEVSLRGEALRFSRSYGTYVMEIILFKLSYPAEFHTQTAVEAAVRLHPAVIHRDQTRFEQTWVDEVMSLLVV